MEKMTVLRSLYRAATLRSCSRFAAGTHHQLHHFHHQMGSRSLFSLSSPAHPNPPTPYPSGFRSPFAMGMGSVRSFSEDVSHLPDIKDPEILIAFKDLMAVNWDELPYSVVAEAQKALSKSTDDEAGQAILANVFRAAEAVEEFGGKIMTLKMELDDVIGGSGEEVKPLPDEYADALHTFYQHYAAYLDSFGPDEAFLRKKVETELGSKMIYLKMRCGGLGAEWGKVMVLGTSGLAGSYVEQRA